MTVVHLTKSTIVSSSYARHLLANPQEQQAQGAAPCSSVAKTAKDGSNDCPKISQGITIPQLKDYCGEFDADIKNKLATLTISREAYSNALENREVYLKHPPVFSNKLEIDAPITDQKSSGRCWIFAGLNMLRQRMMKEYNLEDLELSQPFIFFYDKLEKSNWFLENVLNTLDEDLDGRVVQYLLKDPVGDGGQWDMFVALIEKYGVVPKEAYPETHHTSSSGQMDGLVTTKLREYAKTMRAAHAKGKSVEEVRGLKGQMLKEIHRIMSVSLGQPPKKLNWAFYNKDKKFHEFRDITPLQFYKDHVKQDCKNLVSLINDPRNGYMKKYTVKYLGNVHGAEQVHYINLSVDHIKEYAASVIKSGRPVWFGCDVGKFHSRNKGMMDPELIDYKAAFDFDFGMTKAERLQYGESMMTHAMVLTGVHIEDDKTVRWRIENSWGDSYGNKGYLTMTDKWFDEFVYQIVLEKSDLPKEVLDVLDQEAVVLPPWDPMGALAK
ncbi:bleomycin hydrolase [Coemansia sp. RSA 1813]|nr:bleomycin hydrolase [Coemansia sp. RSA 1646]KAJ1773515.1 bleomycin hydrolase [Coemansia sp. RSA 1843]KAJ2090522.1 bleomycin hydrolase [Coemansia sp. RSA 986]KAJ2216390.1 bleomycin hydrolase [Coemansia sp. RSA 487]KAJ2570824.1 bleomycin hydrolase [Coemansia sp. RSA 1813]